MGREQVRGIERETRQRDIKRTRGGKTKTKIKCERDRELDRAESLYEEIL